MSVVKLHFLNMKGSSYTHEFTVAVTACPRPAQDQASQNHSIEREMIAMAHSLLKCY